MRKFGAKLLEVLRKGDMVLLALCVLTSVFGIVMVAASTAYDGSSRYVIIQTGALITGILLYLALTAFDIDILAGQRTLLFLFNTAFLAMLLVWGVEGTSGNKSWLHFPFLPFNIQPAEVCKITYIIILAKTMSLNRNRISSLRSVGTLTFHMLWIVALIVVISHDTGVALIFMFLFVVMAYVGGVSGWWFLGGAGAVAAVSPYLWKYFIRDDQKQRILALIDPSIDPDGLGVLWQTNKSLEALRNGGLTGQGLFHGDLTSIGYLPAQHTEQDTPVLSEAKRWLDVYFTGREPDFLPPLHPAGSPFRQEVWALLRQIPYGETTTYRALAEAVARKRGLRQMSAQAVGGAVGHNPISIIVPCHRVVGSDGSLTGYAGGLERKVQLLRLEGVDMSRLYVPKKGTAL